VGRKDQSQNQDDQWRLLEFGSKCTFFRSGVQIIPGDLKILDLFTVDDSDSTYKVVKKIDGKKLTILAERISDKGFMRVKDLISGEVYRAEALCCHPGGGLCEFLVTHRGRSRWLPASNTMYA